MSNASLSGGSPVSNSTDHCPEFDQESEMLLENLAFYLVWKKIIESIL
jgi:hypothetical protein